MDVHSGPAQIPTMAEVGIIAHHTAMGNTISYDIIDFRTLELQIIHCAKCADSTGA